MCQIDFCILLDFAKVIACVTNLLKSQHNSTVVECKYVMLAYGYVGAENHRCEVCLCS